LIPYQNTNMKEPKHTNGRWEAERSQDAGGYFEWFVRRDGDAVAIASDITDPETGQPSEANAVLLAAAPELLDALKACALVLAGENMTKNGLIAALEKARAAIAKAKP
jgi:hypothetical protein